MEKNKRESMADEILRIEYEKAKRLEANNKEHESFMRVLFDLFFG